jgi:hypothetical protein
MSNVISDFGSITLTAESVSQQGVVDNGPQVYKSALLENIDGASAAWGAKVVWLLLAIVFALGAAYMFVGALDTDNDSASMVSLTAVGAIISVVCYTLYQRSKMCVLTIFAGQLTITDRINVVGLDPAFDFIAALERAQKS